MNNLFLLDARVIRRVICAMLATLMLVAGLPFIIDSNANAAQLQSRSIQMSDSAPSGTSIPVSTVGSGTNVTYRVSFTTVGTANSLIIDFCKEDPIIGDTCTAPTGMVTSGVGLATVTSGGNIQGGGAWTVASSSAGHITVAKGTGSAATAGAQQFDLTGITNPSSSNCTSPALACSFYARIYTYSVTDPTTATPNPYSGPTGPGSYVDYGGIALSTASTIQITARVQEQLTFCVSNADPATWTTPNNDDCADQQVGQNPPVVTLGVSVGAGQPVLDPSRVDTGSIYSQVSTNATHGAVIDMRNSNTLCGGLSADSGNTCAIPAVNSGSSTGAPIVAGTAAFGMCSVTYSPSSPVDSTIVGSMTPNAPYFHSGNSCTDATPWYGMDTGGAGGTTPSNGGSPATNLGNVESTFGSIVAATTTPVHHADNHYVFAATPSLTTPAGIYTANLNMIATGTF
jgi:hypothetical protein